MPTTLVPTVHERVARCNASLFLDRLAPGAEVVVSIDGAETSAPSAGHQMHFPVPVLNGGETIRAKQDAGSGFTPWSPEVEVEDAFVPPVTSPHLPEEVGACSQCVYVSGMTPGCEVELSLLTTADIVGHGTADRAGNACVGVKLDAVKGEGFDWLVARMLVCKQGGPPSATPISHKGILPLPEIHGPLFGCQRVIPTSNLNPGARVRYEMNTDDLGSFCSCWDAANVWIGTDLVTNRQVRAIPYWDSDACKQEGTPSAWEPILQPDERIKPVVQPALIEGDQTIRVHNQIAGSILLVRIRPDSASPYEEFGPVAASQEPEIDLNAPLVAGNVVTVVQTLCMVSEESEPVTVLPPPPVILAPVVVPPLYECGTAVQVSNLHQGAFVQVLADGIVTGTHWAGNDPSIAVPANLVANHKITARQRVGGIWSALSDPPVQVEFAQIESPRIIGPVAKGDRGVWVSHVSPGSHVSIWEGSIRIGSVDATEPIVLVPTSPVSGTVFPRASLCGSAETGSRVEAIDSPCSGGHFETSAEQFQKYADFDIPEVVDGGKYTVPMEGQLYFPSDDGKSWASGGRNLPLVVIAHGYWEPNVDSYLGYDYLARHLSRWGMVVLSLNLDEVNLRTSNEKPQQYTRGEIVLHAIDLLKNDHDVGGRIDFNRIGLIGHSMGGEGVVYAQFLNDTDGRGYGIRGVVSIAPTNHRPEAILRNTKYLQLLGSMDILSQSLESVVKFNGFRIHDRAWYPKSHAWIYGARHNPFNRSWVADQDLGESGYADLALPPATHELIARCLINAFLQDALASRTEYSGYLEGSVLPQSLRGLDIFFSHRQEPRRVIDNFGDADEQEALAAEAIDKTSNRLGGSANAVGDGLVNWEDVELSTTSAHSPHQGLATDLAWNPPIVADVIYSSETGPVAANEIDAVAIRIGQFLEDNAVNPLGVDADVFVTLDDGANRATVRAGCLAAIPYPDVQQAAARLCPMRTIRIPVDAFTAANPQFDRSSIKRISLDLTARPTGRLFVDDIEISE